MSESEELKAYREKQLADRKQFKIELSEKYGKLAKKRLAQISKKAGVSQQLVDMKDDEFNAWLDSFFNQHNQSNQL